MSDGKTEELLSYEPTKLDYPTKPPLYEAMALLSIFREGRITDQLPRIGKFLWIIQGYAENLLIGEPPTTDVATPVASPNLEFLQSSATVLIPEFCEALQTFVDNHQSDEARPVFQAEIVDRTEAIKILKDVPWDKILLFIAQYGPSLIPLLLKK